MEDIVYWTKDTFGLKPVVSMYHMILLKSAKGAIVANRQVAATHFFNAGLEMLVRAAK